MTIIKADVVADSITENGDRLTTLQCVYPWFIHAEVMTHRKLSRNAASARAIPTSRMLKMVWENPAVPLVWGKNQSGMQAYTQVGPVRRVLAKSIWLTACVFAIGCTWLLSKLGLHKQIGNRLLSPFLHIHVVLSATNFDNLLALRDHPAAEPHFQILAGKILEALNESTPKLLKKGEWHLPYVTEEERTGFVLVALIEFSVARCARVSYLNHDKSNPKPANDRRLYHDLIVSRPAHASPAEHQATPGDKGVPSGNFEGWVQFRKTLDGENVDHYAKLLRKG